MANKHYQVSAIGCIKVSQQGVSLHIDNPFIEGLKGIQEFGHVTVLWWSHQLDAEKYRRQLICEQPYRYSPTEVGVFATRSPARPNPILLTTVAVLHVDEKEGVIHIPFIDAEDNSPLLDIKPYHPSLDRIKEIRVPDWCRHWPQWQEDSATFDWEAEFINAN